MCCFGVHTRRCTGTTRWGDTHDYLVNMHLLLIFQCCMAPFVHMFLGYERDRFKITPVISWNVENVSVALCCRFWGIFLDYLKQN